LGIIQKQTIRGTTYAYVGVIVGFVTTALIYPKIFTTDEIGLLRLLAAYSALFAQFATLGFTRVATMMFPYFRNYENKHNGFFSLAFGVNLAGLSIAVIILLLFKPLILGSGVEKSLLFSTYFYYILPLLFFTLVFLLLDNYYKVLYNSVQGTFLKDFAQRVIILLSAVLFLFGFISFRDFVMLFLFAFFVPAIVLLILLLKERQISLRPNLKFISSELRNKMFMVSFFGILTSFSGLLVLNIDSIMINAMLDLSSTGIYAITFFFGVVILIPSRSLLKISSVIIADSWKNNDIKTINSIYFKSCLNQLILASLLFVGIWANIHNIFRILPPEYEAGKYVIFFISLSSLIQMAGGTSNMILFTSPRYKTHTYFMLMLVVLLVISNFIFIPMYGITGAALASALSFFVFNMLKFLYLKSVFKFKPYNYKVLLVILFSVITYVLSTLIPEIEQYWIDIIIRSVLISGFYLFLILVFKISDDMNGILQNWIKIIMGRN